MRRNTVPAPPLQLVLTLVRGKLNSGIDTLHVVGIQLTDAHLILRQLHGTLLARRVRHGGRLTDSVSVSPVQHSESRLLPMTAKHALDIVNPVCDVTDKNLAIANRSRVSCINTNNNTMTLKSGLEVTQGH